MRRNGARQDQHAKGNRFAQPSQGREGCHRSKRGGSRHSRRWNVTGGSATQASERGGEKQSGASIRRGGRNFMVAFYAALRAIKLYPLEHSAVQKTLAELSQVAEELRLEEGELEFRISGEFIFLNSTRLRLDLSNYATFGHILTLCKLAGIGAIHVGTSGTARDWSWLRSLLGGETKAAPAERLKEILARLRDAKVETFQL